MHCRLVYGAMAGVLGLLLIGCEMPTTDLKDSARAGAAAETREAGTPTAPPGARLTVQVAGSVVNVRAGPSLDAPILDQVQQGDELQVTGISADHQWLQIAVTAERRWIYADLTDITRDGRAALAVVEAAALLACPETGPSPSLRCDKAVLLAVRDALRGANTEALRTWRSANALADFEGIQVGGQPPRVVAIAIPGSTALRGVLPPQVGQLRQLQVLDLRGHRLTALPPEIGQLRQLQVLDLSFNRLLGPLSPELGQLAQLQFLDLGGNELWGPLPPELGQLTALEELSLAFNMLTGSLPSELGQLSALQTLYLHNNRFTGRLPAELGRLSSLRELSFAHNQLTGPFPPNWSPMPRLGPWWLRTNPLPGSRLPALVAAGTYPHQTDPAAGHYHLQLTGERVTATFTASRPPGPPGSPAPLFVVPPPFRPPYPIQRSVVGQPGPTDGAPDPDPDAFPRFWLQIGADGAVHYGDDTQVARGDRLAYTLRTVWGTTPAANDQAVLEILDTAWFEAPVLSRTPPPVRRESHIVRSWFVPRDLFVTRRADGRVTALGLQNLGSHPIPPALGELTALQYLDLSTRFSILYGDRLYRGLMGPIPPTLGQLTQLESLRLGGNYLTGPIPPELGQLTQLHTLSLGNNLLTGPIPPALGQLTQLKWLWLGNNLLTGAVPPELGQLTRLYDLTLSSHDYDRIRAELPALVQAGLALPAAPLTGALPATLGQLTNLVGLDLSGNQFSALPPELGQLADLTHLYAFDNRLLALPPEIGQLASLQKLWLQGNQLTALPPEIGQLAQLTELMLCGNRLTALLPEIGQLTHLQELGLGDNQLTALPPEIGQLAHLEILHLQHNQLTALPPQLGPLPQLSVVNLRHNRLTGCLPRSWQEQQASVISVGNSMGSSDLPFCPH